VRTVASLLVIAALSIACGGGSSQSADFRYHVENVDGPPVTLLLNEAPVTTLRCQSFVELPSPRFPLPEYPWAVTVLRPDGRVDGPWVVDGTVSLDLFIRTTSSFQQNAPGIAGVPPKIPCPT
jgi:hypothetical protein